MFARIVDTLVILALLYLLRKLVIWVLMPKVLGEADKEERQRAVLNRKFNKIKTRENSRDEEGK